MPSPGCPSCAVPPKTQLSYFSDHLGWDQLRNSPEPPLHLHNGADTLPGFTSEPSGVTGESALVHRDGPVGMSRERWIKIKTEACECQRHEFTSVDTFLPGMIWAADTQTPEFC